MKKILWLDESFSERRVLLAEIEKAHLDDNFTQLFARNIFIDRIIAAALVGVLTGGEIGNSERCRRRRWSRVVLSHVRGKVDSIVETILRIDNVDRLSLSGSFQTCISGLLGEGLARSTSLKELSLFPSALTRHGASSLAKGFSSNSSLEEIALGGSQLDYEFMRRIIANVQSNPRIYTIRMDGCDLVDDQINELSASLCNCKNLRELSLVRNSFQSTGMRGIALVLRKCSLEKLNLSAQNPVSQDHRLDIYPLIRSIQIHSQGTRSLRELDLSQNNLDDGDFSNIGDSLKHNVTLEKLVLVRNRITDDGLCKFLEPWTRFVWPPQLQLAHLSLLYLGEASGDFF